MNERLFAVGDIHGCYDPLRELIDDKIRITRNDRVIFLGDYIDRGSESKEVVDFIIDLKNNGFDIVTLIGNHESMLLNAFHDERHLPNWLMNGGGETLSSFGISSPAELLPHYVSFFNSLQFFYSLEQFLFVHAGFNDDLTDPFEDRYQMIWSRGEVYTNPIFNGKIIIHGHTPVALSYCRRMINSGSRVLNIDTGCVYGEGDGYGHLTAVELHGMKIYSV